MAPIGTLWGHIGQPQTKVILSVAAVNGFELDTPEWSFHNKPADFMAKFPYGKIPSFEGEDGFKLIEGAAIARYLSGIGPVSLLGTKGHDAALVDQWVHFAEHEISVPAGIVAGMIYGYYTPFTLEILNKNTERIASALAHLESHLAARPSGYVALESVTLADFVLAGAISAASGMALGAAERAQYPHVFSHYEKVTADERVKKYWGTEQFLDVRITEPRPMPFAK